MKKRACRKQRQTNRNELTKTTVTELEREEAPKNGVMLCYLLRDDMPALCLLPRANAAD